MTEAERDYGVKKVLILLLKDQVIYYENLLSDILAELEANPNDGGQSRLSPELVELIKKVLEK